MPRVPDYVIDKKKQKLQSNFVVAGFVAGGVSWACFANEAGGVGFAAAVISGAAFWIASKIKPKRYYGGSFY